jgi:AraC-like DNA-binding protein
MLYNPLHVYERQLIDPRGDVCEFFGINPRLLADVSASVGWPIDEIDRPFKDSHSPCSSDVYLKQRSVFGMVEAGACDSMQVEEAFFQVLGELVRGQVRFAVYRTVRTRREAAKHREQVEAAKEYIGREFRTALKLEGIAAEVGCSVFHLCRIFKRHTGESVHSFLTQMRLRSSIERLLDGEKSLTDLALDYSFSSHSHFTNAFRKCFGLAPKQLRKLGWRAVIGHG